MFQIIPLPKNPKEKRWLVIIIGETNGFPNEQTYFKTWEDALDHIKAWFETVVNY